MHFSFLKHKSTSRDIGRNLEKVHSRTTYLGAAFVYNVWSLALVPTQTPRYTKRKKIHPEIAKAWVPESKTPMVQPSAVIEPQPNKMPPTKAVDVFLTVSFENSNLPPAIAAAKDPPTKPKTSQPLLVIV
jgi:hypothetical protein